MQNIRTDLASESHQFYCENNQKEPPGIDVENVDYDQIKATRVIVHNEEGAEAIGKPIGNYTTIEIPPQAHREQSLFERICVAIQKELSLMLNIGKDDTVLIVGLGNWNVTPDALGPKVLDSILITRHMLELVPEEIEEGVRPVCGVTPGVLGLTGIESSEIIRGIVQRVNPKLVIAIDALASRKMERISTTIQIANTGINPGAGIGNRRNALNIDTLGVPVIAIGVPTVVDAATLVNDSIEIIIDSLSQSSQNQELFGVMQKIDSLDRHSLISSTLGPSDLGNMVVTPKEVDDIIDDMSELIANGINIALHDGISIKDFNKYA